MEGQPLKILIVDDHEVVRVGLRTFLGRHEAFKVVGEAGSMAEAIEMAARQTPDVVVMDIRLPDGSGVEACRAIRADNPNAKILMLTSYADEEAVLASILAGAAGYLLKEIRGKELIRAIETVAGGSSLLDPAVTQTVLERIRRTAAGSSDEKLSALSEQERRILALVAEGKTNKEIAELVCLSDKTVKNYVSSILSKLGLHRRSQAAAYFVRKKG